MFKKVGAGVMKHQLKGEVARFMANLMEEYLDTKDESHQIWPEGGQKHLLIPMNSLSPSFVLV